MRWRIVERAPLAGLVVAVPGVVHPQGKLTFETFEDAKKEHRWRLKAANGMVVAVASEGYKAKADAEKGKDLLKGAKDAEVVEGKP